MQMPRKGLHLSMELQVIIGAYLFFLLILFCFGRGKPAALPVAAERQNRHWSAYRQGGSYDLRPFGYRVDEGLQIFFAEEGLWITESSWRLREKKGKEDFLWSETEYHLEADTQTPLQTVERLFLHMKEHKEAFGLEVLYADGIILDGTVYYRIDLGLPAPAGDLVTHRLLVGLPKLTAVDSLKKWAVGRRVQEVRPGPATKAKETAVAREKRRGAAKVRNPVVAPDRQRSVAARQKGAEEKKGQPIGLKPVVKPGLQVGKKQPPKKRVTVKPPSGQRPPVGQKEKPVAVRKKHLTLLPIVPREAKHREKPTAVKKKPMRQVRPVKPEKTADPVLVVKPSPKAKTQPEVKKGTVFYLPPFFQFELKPKEKPVVQAEKQPAIPVPAVKPKIKATAKPVAKKGRVPKGKAVVKKQLQQQSGEQQVMRTEQPLVKEKAPVKEQPVAKARPAPAAQKEAVKTPAGSIIVPPVPGKPATPVRPQPPQAPQAPRYRGKARVAIIVDDYGFVQEPAEAYFDIAAPLTIAVLPGGEYSREHARRAAEVGFEVILHQPLEPINMDRNNPGPGLIHSGMSDEEIIRIFRENLADVPGAVGFNNHMGSKGSRDPRIMELLLKETKKLGLFFVDSRSISWTVGVPIARRLGVPYAARSVFLDNDLEQMRQQLDLLMEIALRDGEAVGITHARPGRARVIKEYLPKFRRAGIEIVPVSALLKQ